CFSNFYFGRCVFGEFPQQLMADFGVAIFLQPIGLLTKPSDVLTAKCFCSAVGLFGGGDLRSASLESNLGRQDVLSDPVAVKRRQRVKRRDRYDDRDGKALQEIACAKQKCSQDDKQ